MASHGIDRQFIFLNNFFPIKYLIFFVSVVYLNLFLNNVVVPLAIICFSSFSNSSTFLQSNLVSFLSSISHLNSHCFSHFVMVLYI
jgi:hypothetical protein